MSLTPLRRDRLVTGPGPDGGGSKPPVRNGLPHMPEKSGMDAAPCPPRASPLPVIDRTSAHPAGNLRITSPFRRARKGDYGRNWEAIAAPGPVVPTLGAAQVGSYLGNTGCDGNVVATAWPLTLAVKTHFGDSRRE